MCEPATIKYTSGSSFTCSDKTDAKAVAKRTYESAVELFAKLCKENRKEVTNNLQGGTRKDIDLGKVREAFIERYYKDVEALHEKKKKKKEESFDEWLERIEKEG